MHVLRGALLFLLIALAADSCAPQGSLTPRRAFYDLREAFRKSDAAAFERLLSRASLGKIRHASALVTSLSSRQHKSLSELYGIPAQKLERLSVRGFLRIFFTMDRPGNVIGTALSYNIVGVNREGRRAVVRVSNGMELAFVKEGPYWKFDLTGL
jgi:hypothetical protein